MYVQYRCIRCTYVAAAERYYPSLKTRHACMCACAMCLAHTRRSYCVHLTDRLSANSERYQLCCEYVRTRGHERRVHRKGDKPPKPKLISLQKKFFQLEKKYPMLIILLFIIIIGALATRHHTCFMYECVAHDYT